MKASCLVNRRHILAAGTGAAVAFLVPRSVLGRGQRPPSETLNVAGVGVGGMGSVDLLQVAKEANVVAMCDVDSRALQRNAKVHPKAKHHVDFRKMLETQKDIDAVMVGTPDHMHAVVSAMAMKMGKHVFCQKPLTHSVYEARQLGEIAKQTGVAT
ncbi:MAG TPA: oxidoreductase, partial [Planctomycetaceae bacterium]|nr:oxidoreductase [Planctomycetaceae bacterium]